LQQYPYDIPTEAFPFEIFKQAFVAIQSCVVHLQVLLFIPFASGKKALLLSLENYFIVV